MAAPRQDHGRLRTEPAVDHIAVVLDTPFEECRGLFVGTGGNATITINGKTALYKNLLAGMVYPFRATLVAAGATAADFIALY